MEITRRVAFYETDMMGVVHHSNYLRYFEDSRLEWLAQAGLVDNFNKADGFQFAVVDAGLKYKKPATYGEELVVKMQVRKNKAKLEFQYAIYNSHQELLCTGYTTHVTVDAKMNISRIPREVEEKLEKEEWIEIWP